MLIGTILLLCGIHQFENTLTWNHCLLQHRLLSGQLNQRLIQTPQIGNKGIEYPHFKHARHRETKQDQQPTQHHRWKQAQQRTQQKTIQTQRFHSRQIVRAARFAHSLTKSRLLTKLLDHAHTADDFVKAIIDVCQIAANTTGNGRAVTLIDEHHYQYQRKDHHRHQRHAPVKAKHRYHHGADQCGTAQHGWNHRDVEIADHFGVVSHAWNNLPDRLGIKGTQRLTECGIHHVTA